MKEKKVIDLGDLNEDSLQGDIPFLDDDSIGKDNDSGESGEFPFEFPDDGEEDKPPFMVEAVPETPAAKDNPEVADKINSLEEKLDQLDTTLETVRKLDEETEEKINRIEKSLEEMLHLYELVTNEMNPFVDAPKKDGDNGGKLKLEPPVVKKAESINPVQNELHLTKISNEPSSLMLVLKWLEFLLKKAGYVGMIKSLLYYEELGWISERVRSRLIKLAEDIKARGGGYGKRPLTIRDHMVSLFFISKLQGLKISPMVYASVVEELQELGLKE